MLFSLNPYYIDKQSFLRDDNHNLEQTVLMPDDTGTSNFCFGVLNIVLVLTDRLVKTGFYINPPVKLCIVRLFVNTG